MGRPGTLRWIRDTEIREQYTGIDTGYRIRDTGYGNRPTIRKTGRKQDDHKITGDRGTGRPKLKQKFKKLIGNIREHRKQTVQDYGSAWDITESGFCLCQEGYGDTESNTGRKCKPIKLKIKKRRRTAESARAINRKGLDEDKHDIKKENNKLLFL